MKTFDAIKKRRSIRRFKQKAISFKILEKLVDAARLAPSAANLQPCEFIIVNDKEKCQAVFLCTRWAGYLKEQGAPTQGVKPTAYIVILINKEKPQHALSTADAAAAIENILLAATEEKLGSCWIGSLDKDKLKQILNIPDNCIIDSVVALGYPAEKSYAEDLVSDIKYWKDTKGNMHVPKRKLKDILHINGY